MRFSPCRALGRLRLWRDETASLDPAHPVFTMPHSCSIVRMLRADLSDADIAYRADDGPVVAFHALRPTFIPNLASGGVHPCGAEHPARH